MKAILNLCSLLILASYSQTALAQPENEIRYGWGEEIEHVGDLPPNVRAQLLAETQHDFAIGFRYSHCYLFGSGFNLWTWGGKHVLFDDEIYWDLSDDEFSLLLGKEQFAALGKPLYYRVPAGLVTVLAIAGAVLGFVFLSPQSRAKSLFASLRKDAKYQAALQLYVDSLPPDCDPTPEERRQALAAAVHYLQVEHGIVSQRAEANLNLLVAEIDKERSYALRNDALAYEEDGQWDIAIALYQQAADLRQKWDRKDYQFLLKCIRRVEGRRGPAAGE